MRFSLPVLLVFVLLGSEVRAESQGIIVRQATVYTDASIAGGRVGNVPAGVMVTMFKRKGGWQEIYSEERSIIGWVRSYQVRAGEFNTEAVSREQEDDRGFLRSRQLFAQGQRFLYPGFQGNQLGYRDDRRAWPERSRNKFSRARFRRA